MEHLIRFKPILSQYARNGELIRIIDAPNSARERILEWYREQSSDLDVADNSINWVGEWIVIDFGSPITDRVADTLADPDEDCNSPIYHRSENGDEEWFVSGAEVERLDLVDDVAFIMQVENALF